MEKWFENILQKVMKNNAYKSDWITCDVCDLYNKWTPCDLIAREYLNNGGGSAKGFLGITTAQCSQSYLYMREIKQELIEKNLVHKEAWNNCGFELWKNYDY